MAQILPPEKNIVRMLFGTLFGQDVAVDARPAGEMKGPVGPFVAAYGNGRPTPLGVVLFDLRMAVITSAALTMIPPVSAEEAIKDGQLNEMMRENLPEIMNLSSRLLGRSDGPPVRFEGSYDTPAVAPMPVREVIASPFARDDWSVTLPGYGAGGLAILTSKPAGMR